VIIKDLSDFGLSSGCLICSVNFSNKPGFYLVEWDKTSGTVKKILIKDGDGASFASISDCDGDKVMIWEGNPKSYVRFSELINQLKNIKKPVYCFECTMNSVEDFVIHKLHLNLDTQYKHLYLRESPPR
jgi:hypothetical protein